MPDEARDNLSSAVVHPRPSSNLVHDHLDMHLPILQDIFSLPLLLKLSRTHQSTQIHQIP
jgi:hypothetical protein